MTTEVIAGQLDLLDLLSGAEDAPSPTASEIRGPGARVLFHVRVGAVSEDGTRFLTTAGHCGLCGSRSLHMEGAVSVGCRATAETGGDQWSLSYCGRCHDLHLRNRNLVQLIQEHVIHLQVHDDPGDCDNCDRIAAGSWISCQHGRGPLYDRHVCAVCGRTFKGSRDPAGLHGYGPVSAAHCSEACSRPAYEMVQARYAELTNTTQED
ncbi:hypothetical protein [Kocuria rosea]|uniref:hypothetical protein n=1 Tax=Kocuria rosea TaxID=1275 RepID=UPI003D357078